MKITETMIEHFPQFETYMKVELGRADGTVKAYCGDLKRFFKETALQPEEVTTADIRKYLSTLSDKSPRYYHRVLSSLRKYFEFCRAVKKTRDDNPAQELAKPKLPKRNPPSLSIEDVRNLIVTAGKESRRGFRTRNWVILSMLFYTGLRISELASLKIDQISYREGLPYLLTVVGKGNKERQVVLPEEAGRALNVWLNKRRKAVSAMPPHLRKEELWTYEQGGKLKVTSIRAIQNMCKRMGNLAGVTKSVHPHLLRHTFATESARNGAQLHALRDALGHSSLATTGIYLHANTSDLEKLADCLPSATL